MNRSFLLLLTTPEFYYGFVLLNIGWQILYLFLASDPVRFRPIMLPAFFAKASAPVALWRLFLTGRISADWVNTTYLDGVFAVLFLVSYWLTGSVSFGEINSQEE